MVKGETKKIKTKMAKGTMVNAIKKIFAVLLMSILLTGGFILSSSDGPLFPWVNFAGVAMFAGVLYVGNKFKYIFGY